MNSRIGLPPRIPVKPRKTVPGAIRSALAFLPWPLLAALGLVPLAKEFSRMGLTRFGFSRWDVNYPAGITLLGASAGTYVLALALIILQVRMARGAIDEAARRAACLLAGMFWLVLAWQSTDWMFRYGPYVVRQVSAAAAERAHPGIEVSDDGMDIAVHTEFEWGLSRRVKDLVRANPRVRTITLSGPGGMAWEGTELARFILARGLDTRVVAPCYSACAVAFLAGRRRKLRIDGGDGLLGFHSPHVDGPDGAERRRDDGMDEVLRRSGARPAFVWRVWETAPDSLWRPGPEDLAAGGVPVDPERR